MWFDIYKHLEIAAFFNNHHSHQANINNSSLLLFPVIQICINSDSFDKEHEEFMDSFRSTFITVQFTRLKINCRDIPIEKFLRILHLLPNLDSLEVLALPHIQSNWLFDNHEKMHQFSTSINNKIINVNLNKIINIEQMHFFLNLCPYVQYFQVNVPKHMDFTILVRFILIQACTYNHHLRFLSLAIQNASQHMVHKLQKMIDNEKLLSNYIVKRIGSYILLKWNLHQP